jgi:succinate dehydrogenase / fumarate reductase membrane anchor subunit
MVDKGTPLGQVRGTGSAHEGAGHWMTQRVTAASNFFAMTYFVVSLLLLPGLDYGTVSKWLGGLVPSTMLVLLVVSLFWHARIGLQVMVEDYVHDTGNRFGVTVLLNLLAFGGAGIAIMAILRIALGAAA